MLIEHVGITVKDLEMSARFYEALFGVPRLEDVSWRGQKAEYVARMMGQPGLTLDAVFIQLPGSSVILELVEFHGLAAGESAPVPHYKVNGTHLGLYVEDLDAGVERARAAGVKDFGEVVPIQHGPYMGTGGRSVTFHDPDGNNLQFMEITGRPGALALPVNALR
jgi:catechol 2,3-dioxygenase-like lactoylglutathione lyase family enzyme